MVAAWPEPETLASWIDPEAERAVGMLCGVVGAVRSTRARYGISPKQELAVVVNAQPENVTVLEELSSQISVMACVSEVARSPQARLNPLRARPWWSRAPRCTACSPAWSISMPSALVLPRSRRSLPAMLPSFSKKLSNPGFWRRPLRDRGEGPRQARRDRGPVGPCRGSAGRAWVVVKEFAASGPNNLHDKGNGGILSNRVL